MLIDNIFVSLLSSGNFFTIVFPHLDERYFNETHHSKIFTKIKEYNLKYNKVPKISDLKLLVEMDNDISESDSDDIYNYLDSMKKVERVTDEKLLIEETENYVQQRALELSVLAAVDIIQDPKKSNGEIEDVIKSALAIEFEVKIGHDYFAPEDVKARMQSYLEDELKIPLDIELMNVAMGGGLVRKSLFLLLANTNVGKCQKFDTNILLSDGSYKSIEWLYKNRPNINIITMQDNHKLSTAPISEYFDSGVIDCYKLETKDGIYTEPSSTHPYYTLDGWKKVSELKVGDKIAIPKQYDMFDSIDNSFKTEEAELLGLFLADGSITNTAAFSNVDIELLNLFKTRCLELHSELKFRYANNCIYPSYKNGSKNPVVNWLKNIKMFGLHSHTKYIPDEIFTASKYKISKFLGAFYACDGWVSSNSNKFELGLTLCNKKLLTQIRSLLLRFGIKTRINTSSSSHTKDGTRFLRYTLTIKDYVSVKKFYDNISIPLSYKQKQLQTYIDEYGDSNFRTPYNSNYPKELWNYIKTSIKAKGITLRQLGMKCETGVSFRTSSNISNQLLGKINSILDDPFIGSLLDGDICFDEITSLEYIGKHQCYDLTIDHTHNFIANDTVVHNTVWLCHIASSLIRSGKDVLFVSAEMGFEEIGKRVDSNILSIDINNLSNTLDKGEYKNKIAEAFKKTHGNLIIKEYPAGSANAKHLRNLLNEIRTKKGYLPEILILDHLTLFASYRLPATQTGTHTYVMCVAEEIRAIAKEYNIVILTAAQFNRGAKSKGVDAGNEDVGLGYGISQTADWSGTIAQTPELKDQNKYILKVAKTRFGSNNESYYTIGIDYLHMRLMNLDMCDQEIPLHIKDKLKKNIENKNEEDEENMFGGFKFE